MSPRRVVAAAVLAMIAGGTASSAQERENVDALGEQAVQHLREYIRVNTINPPGNEMRAVEFFARIFDREGIPYETAEPAPGRGNIWARLEGGSAPALVLLHHTDVVPADERFWSVDPLSGEMRNGYVYGRGALDTKTGGILHLETFLALHRSQRARTRDVIFMATADAAAGGFMGAGWLVEHRRELFDGVGFLLNEGGGGTMAEGRTQFGVEVTQKVPLWLRLVARGEPGHGSRPLEASAVTRLVAALDRLANHAFAPRIVPAVDRYFKGLAAAAAPEWQRRYRDMQTTVAEPQQLRQLQRMDPGLHALTRNTCSITRLEGSNKINVVPPEATAEIDCRLLPDQDPEAFLAELRGVLADPNIEIERIMGFTPAVSSIDTELYRLIERVTARHFPNAVVLPTVQGGFTDSHFFRDLGIVSYGFFPTVTPLADLSGVHGNDERASVESITRGAAMMYEIVSEFVYE